MQRILHIDRLNKSVEAKTYATFLRQLKDYITTYHDIAGVSRAVGVPEEIFEAALNNKRTFPYASFVALMDYLDIKVVRNQTFDYEV